MKKGPGRLDWDHAVALLAVLGLHGAMLYGLWNIRLNLRPDEAVPLFVTLITPPPAQPGPAAPPPPASAPPRQAKPIQRQAPAPAPAEPRHPHDAAEAPVESSAEATLGLSPSDPVAGPPGPGLAGPWHSPSQAAGPVNLASDLAVVCPVRTPPPYPPVSRRLGETGRVVLRVELDETGRVTAAQVITSSGHVRLDTAALAAVRTWRCQPAQRDGQPVRSVAMQPFVFNLAGQ